MNTENVEVLSLIEKNGIQLSSNEGIITSFLTFFADIKQWQQQAATLTITSIEQKSEMKIARTARLALKNIRVEVEHTRKRLKEESLRTGQTIDAIAKILTNEIAPIEKYLEEQEKFAEIQEKNRRDALRQERECALQPFEVETQHYNLSEMTDEAFASLLSSMKVAFEQKQVAIAEAEKQRIEKEEAETKAREAERLENERLKAETEKLRKEKEEAEAKATSERIAREKIEKEQAQAAAQAKAAQDAQIKAEKEAEKLRLKNERAERNRPDKVKLLAFAEEIKLFAEKNIDVKSPESVEILKATRQALILIQNDLINKANSL